MTGMRHFIEGMSKAELHVHVEGTLEPELKFALARRNGIELPYESVDEMRAAYDFDDLPSFLRVYYEGMSAATNALIWAIKQGAVPTPGGFNRKVTARQGTTPAQRCTVPPESLGQERALAKKKRSKPLGQQASGKR